MDNRFVVLLIVVLGLVIVWFAAERFENARLERPISTLTQYRIIGAVLWISCVCMFYLTDLVGDVKNVQDHDIERQCENRNLARVSEQLDYEARIDLLDDQLADANERVPIDPNAVPGYGEYSDPAVQETVDALLASTETDRLKDIADATNELSLEQDAYMAHIRDFPLEDCNGDGLVEVVPGDSDTGPAPRNTNTPESPTPTSGD